MQVTPQQQQVRARLAEEAERRSRAASGRLKRLLPKRDRELVKRQISGSEVTINFPAHKPVGGRWLVDILMEADHFMNQHESGHTGGVPISFGRDECEIRRFGYEAIPDGDAAQAARRDRPRYGAVNVFTSGVGSAPVYGNCALVLHPRVAQAATITLMDSLHRKEPLIGTVDAFDHCIVQLNQVWSANSWRSWLSDLLRAARGMADPSAIINRYLEIQIHAVIQFPTDILYLRGSFESQFGTPTGERLQHWARRQGWPLVWGVQTEMVIDPTVRFPTIDVPDPPRPNWSDAVLATAERFAGIWGYHARKCGGAPVTSNNLGEWAMLWDATPPAARYMPSTTAKVPVTMRDLASRLG